MRDYITCIFISNVHEADSNRLPMKVLFELGTYSRPTDRDICIKSIGERSSRYFKLKA